MRPRTALLTLDFQAGILGSVPEVETAVANARAALGRARSAELPIFHVGLGFSPGYPEISDRWALARRVKENGLFIKGSPSAEFVPGIVEPGEAVVYKHRFGAFSENELHLILRSQEVERLVIFGVSTSGVVLSTLRRAFDLDYETLVIEDACFDRDQEVHRVLTQKIFPVQARVLTTQAFMEEPI